MTRKATLVAVLRGAAAFASSHVLTSMAVLATYDRTPFPATFWWKMLLGGSHMGALLVCAGGLALSHLYLSFLLEREPTTADRSALWRGSVVTFALLWIVTLAVGSAVRARFPIVEGPVPHLRPNDSFRMDRLSRRPTINVHTNARGFRDVAWTPPAPGQYRVAVVGDSIVFGSGITDQDETLTAVLRRSLADDPSFVVHNLSLNGLNFTEEVDLLEAYAGELAPDLVVILHNEQNDLMPTLPYYAGTWRMTVFPLSFVAYVNGIDRFMQDHRLSERPHRLEGLRRDEGRLARLADANGFDVIFTNLHGDCAYHVEPDTPPRQRFFAFSAIGHWRPELTFPNDFHPNPAGVRFLAERVSTLVRRARSEGSAWRGEDEPAPTRELVERCTSRGSPRMEPSAEPPRAHPGPPVVTERVLDPQATGRLRSVFPELDSGELVAGCAIEGLRVDRDTATLSLTRGADRATLVLSDVQKATGAVVTRHFAVERTGSVCGDALERLVTRLRREDDGDDFYRTVRSHGAPAGEREAR